MGYKSPMTYTMIGGFATSNPAVTTTYYCGSTTSSILTTLVAKSKLIIPKKGILRKIKFFTYAGTVVGSNEAWEFFIRKNDTTDTSIGSVSLATAERIWSADLSISVEENDWIVLKTTTPNWVASPTALVGAFEILVEFE